MVEVAQQSERYCTTTRREGRCLRTLLVTHSSGRASVRRSGLAWAFSAVRRPRRPPRPQAQRSLKTGKLKHFFDDAQHKLGPLVEEFGSRANAGSAMQSAIQAKVASQGITGAFHDVVVRVGSMDVTMRGRVIDGVARIGTAFIPK